MDARGTSGRDDPNEMETWLGDDAQDAWTDEHDVEDDVEDDAGSEVDGWVDGGVDGGVDGADHDWDDEVEDDGPEALDVAGVPAEEWYDRDRRSPWWRGTAFYAGAIAGMLVLALVWLVTVVLSGDEPTRAPSTPAAGAASPAAHGSRTSAVERQEAGCADTARALHHALRAAGPALDQWEVHVGAMNKLVVGAITLPQANQFWNQTRVGAHHRLRAFRAAERSLADRSRPCPSPETLTGAPASLRSCARVVEREGRTLAAARTAIRTWSRHVREMEMLRMGHMSAAQATRMWLASWKRGVHQLEAYRAAAHDQRRGRCPA